MPVIAMTREMGSQGRDVALGLAEELGFELFQHQLVPHIADKMHVKESSVNRYLEGKAGLFERWGISDDKLSLFTTEEVLEVASKPKALIRGWGATYVLRTLPHVLCLRVCAPMRHRVRVLMERVGIESEELARREIEHNDAAHTRLMNSLFHVGWERPQLYDLVLNSERMSVRECIDIVKSALEAKRFRETDESYGKLEIMMLEARIRSALRGHPRTSNASPSFEAQIIEGTHDVRLTGVAFDKDFMVTAEDVVRGVAGVEGVDNQLLLIKNYAGP